MLKFCSYYLGRAPPRGHAAGSTSPTALPPPDREEHEGPDSAGRDRRAGHTRAGPRARSLARAGPRLPAAGVITYCKKGKSHAFRAMSCSVRRRCDGMRTKQFSLRHWLRLWSADSDGAPRMSDCRVEFLKRNGAASPPTVPPPPPASPPELAPRCWWLRRAP